MCRYKFLFLDICTWQWFYIRGNELYSMLSRISRQSYLLLTELPTMVTVEDTDYSFEFSES
jgi:hypothetical protein